MRNSGVFANAGQKYISEFDLRCNYELWVTHILGNESGNLSQYAATAKQWFQANDMNGDWARAFFGVGNAVGVLPEGQTRGLGDLLAGNMSSTEANKTKEHINEDAKKIYGYIESLRQTYYGKQFLCELSEKICSRNTQDLMVSDGSSNSSGCIATEKTYHAQPTNDGGWVPNGDSIIGVSDPYLGFFRQEDGRVGSFGLFSVNNVGFGRKLNLDNISADEVLVNTNGDQAYIKAEVGEKIYYVDNKTCVLIKFGEACLTTLTSNETNFPAAFLAVADALKVSLLVSNNSSAQSVVSSDIGIMSGGACCEGSCYEAASAEQCGSGNFYPGQSCGQVSCDGGGGNTTSSPNSTTASPVTSKSNYICGIPVQENMDKAKGGLDISSTNKYQLTPSAVTPSIVAIPMRSNIETYGPYVSNNFGDNVGGCTAEQNTDLSPWVFGSINAMNEAGDMLANSSTFGLNQAETGSVTIAGLPALPFLGTNQIGPNLTGITANVSSSGITTTYNFQTFTPKFGDLAKSAVDQMKSLARNRQKQLQFLRNQTIVSHNINRKLKRINNLGNSKPKDKNVADGASLQRCIIGDIYDWYDQESGNSQRTVVGTDTLSKSVLELRYDYDKKAFMSFDGIFGPVSKNGDGGLPQYANYNQSSSSNEENKTFSAPIAPQPPFAKDPGSSSAITMDQYNLKINQKYLDPLSNRVSSENHHHDGDGAGHAIDIVGRGDEPPQDTMFMNALAQNDPDKYAEDYRFLGLRGPIVLHAWGYDLDGKPVPNASDNDSAAKNGTFTKDNLKDKFLKDWLNKPKTWPVGPLDLRFDRERGVWVSPPGYKIVVAQLTENLEPNSSAKARLVNKNAIDNSEYGGKLYDADGQEITATNDETGEAFIKIVDRIGSSFNKDSMIYAYYDTHMCEYIILAGESKNNIIRFKLIDPCDNDLPPNYGDEWTEYAGYGDKNYDDDTASDSYAVRINCNGEPITADGTLLSDSELLDFNSIGKHLIIVKGVCGKWGPAFNKIAGNIQRWKDNAATGYGTIIQSKKKSNEPSLGSPTPEEPECSTKVPCTISYVDDNDDTVTVDTVYDILYLESYARIIYGELTQDLYCSDTKASEEYSDDYWKTENTNGNASININKFFGNAPNGKNPIYINQDSETLECRVFDPFYVDDPNKIKDSPFYGLSEGSRVVAIFNEKLKKYEIIQSDKKFSNIVRFKIIDKCASGGCNFPDAPNPDNDPWLSFAGFLDKWPNNHILGVRIDCDGTPVDRYGEQVTQQRLEDPDSAKDIFINLYDTMGQHGPAFAGYKSYNNWVGEAFTGFAAITENPIQNSCNNTGSNDGQCSPPVAGYDSYDILFLESYARFIECTLSQDLYPSEEKLSEYNSDDYKSDNPDGNASAELISFYGGSPNAKEPKFYDNCGNTITLRVFDPYEEVDENSNPFHDLKNGDKVLAVFNEKLKKYIIYSAINKKNNSKVVKFALVTNKKASDASATAVLIDEDCKPIDKKGELLSEENFQDNFITVEDPFLNRSNISGMPMSYSSGPALGSNTFNHHINGIPGLNTDGSTGGGSSGSLFGPFIGFALAVEKLPSEYNGAQNTGSTSSETTTTYQIITLERFAQHITGKIGVTEESNGFYYGALTSFWDGRHPITRNTNSITKGLNVIVYYNSRELNGSNSYIIGDFKEGQSASSSDSFSALEQKIDGCRFVAKLNDLQSFSSGENLLYTIVDTETVALAGSTEIKDMDLAEELNAGEVKESSDSDKISSVYKQGFQWSKDDSLTHYENITIKNRPDWSGKGKILKGCKLQIRLDNLQYGDPVYVIEYGETIAQVAEMTASDGLWGTGTASDNEYKIKTSSKTYQGVSPASLNDDDKPSTDAKAINKWMTYQGAKTVSLWDETKGTVQGAQGYRTIFAQQAPTVIYGTASGPFTPEQQNNVSVTAIDASCPGKSSNPIPSLLTQASNPLGYGAGSGDKVTLLRIFTEVSVGGESNYKYIVIGTGAPVEGG